MVQIKDYKLSLPEEMTWHYMLSIQLWQALLASLVPVLYKLSLPEEMTWHYMLSVDSTITGSSCLLGSNVVQVSLPEEMTWQYILLIQLSQALLVQSQFQKTR